MKTQSALSAVLIEEVNKLKKALLLTVLVALISSLFLISCTGTGPDSSPATPIKLRYSGGSPPANNTSVVQKYFADEVNKRSDGRVIVEPYYGAELYNHWEAVDAVCTGALEMSYGAWSHWAGRNLSVSIVDYAGMCISMEETEQVKPYIQPVIEGILQEQGASLVFYTYFGSDGIISRVPLTKPEDAVGLVIRGPATPHLESIKALGATPAQMAAAEVYDALAKKALDGALTSFPSMITRKFIEVAKYVVGPTTASIWLNYMNEDTWNGLPKDVKDLLTEVGEDATAYSYQLTPEAEAEYLAQLNELGTVTILTRQNIGPWMEKWTPVYDTYLQACEDKGVGEDARQLYDAFKKIHQ